MSRDDWFRRHTWTDTDRSDFFARLARSRSGFHKAQYALIQAIELHQSGGPQYARPALDLLDMILERWQNDAQLARVYHQRAVCLRDLGDDHRALAAFRAAFDEQRRRPGLLTMAHLDFAWWVAVSGKNELYDEALAVLDEFEPGLLFPFYVYTAEGARALIMSAVGDPQRARGHARRALEAADARDTGLRCHPTVGLVEIRDYEAHEAIRRLASG